MDETGKNQESISSQYEQSVLTTFCAWFQQNQPTIDEAALQAYSIARDSVESLSSTEILLLLQEHPEWIHQEPKETYTSDQLGVTIGEIARRHVVSFLEMCIQKKGLQAAYASKTR